MNKRENLLSLLRREGYREVPVNFSLCPALIEQYRKNTKSGLPYEEYFGFSWDFVDDMRLPPAPSERYEEYYDPPLAERSEIDGWGVGHEYSPNSMHMTYLRSPMRRMTELEELEAYPFPDFEHADASHQRAQADAIKSRGLAAAAGMQMTIWETSWYLRGMEELMMDMMGEDEKAEFLLDRVTGLAELRAQAYARAGVDILYLGDDIGMQRSPMMSVELYRCFLKPRLARVIAAARRIHPDILIFYHSCGYVTPFVDDLIDAGVDVLNPIQSESMSFAEIHRQYGDRLSFHGTIGTQSVMPFGTPAQVKRAVWDNLDIAGENGGLYVAPTHILEPEVPWENVIAYVEACREYKAGR